MRNDDSQLELPGLISPAAPGAGSSRAEPSLPLVDAGARARFRGEWDRNFAVSANAGSGKTTAISERLAALALAPGAAELLPRTVVVTYTKKAAAQIGQRARQVLLQRLTEEGRKDLSPLDHLERAFFGTIHSFCLKLAQTYGQTLGVNLNPTLVAEDDEALWEEFVEQDSMTFTALAAPQLEAWLRHLALDELFPFARQLDAATAEQLRGRRPEGLPPPPDEVALAQLLALPAKGSGARNLLRSQERARQWQHAWRDGASFLPLFEPDGKAGPLLARAAEWMAPLKRWLAAAAAPLAGELSQRYRAWRFARGVQTYADQIDAAMAVLSDAVVLDRIRAEGWRVILDEAQDTDPQQFAVLVEIARPVGASKGTWPGGGPPPRPGHFCLVGDGQQSIYGSRADIGNFLRHLEAFGRGDGGEVLTFQVTFRAPRAVIAQLNTVLPVAFGPNRPSNWGLPPAEGAPAPWLQVRYEPLEPGPSNASGRFCRLALEPPGRAIDRVEEWLAEEARQLAAWLRAHGPAGVGARVWGEVAVLAPRNDWLLTVRKALEGVGLEVALQTRRTRCGDNPAYAWLTGLLAVCADPENGFEWVGVLREVYGVSDGLIALELRRLGALSWEQPDAHPREMAGPLERLRPLVLQVNDEGVALATFARALAAAGDLEAKAWALDPSGSIAGELDRLLAEAATLGLEGAGPRDWLQQLLNGLDDGRASGKPSPDAINLLTSHSSKGLEWPVVVVAGFWRGIGKPPEQGLKLVREGDGEPRLYLDRASLPAPTQEARDRERVRELTRLLYVTLTRPRRTLVIPWAEGFGGRQREAPSFAELWGADLQSLPLLAPETEIARPVEPAAPFAPRLLPAGTTGPAPALPARVLPHELAQQAPDLVRSIRHEAAAERPWPSSGEEAIDYGLWWHETMEFMPWAGPARSLDDHEAQARAAAEAAGFGTRAVAELAALRTSDAWRELSDPRWCRQAELAVLAPWRTGVWVDGVIDLVLHDPLARELWVVDWKTNRRRRGETGEGLLQRLAQEYAPQLQAYSDGLRPLFPDTRVGARLYASAAGAWVTIGAAGQ